MDGSSLLDLPDELLKLIVAGSTGQGVAAMSCCCKRLRAVAKQLQGSPIMCSAMSTDHDLHTAIKDATHRAMAGSWGAVDFALIFVANYGLPKKYTDPGDASHAVDMLLEVLGKDIPIVGCACDGIMGIGPYSKPLEVDPRIASYRRRRSSAKGGHQSRGVTVLLGKVPPGCAVRAFAAAEGAPAAGAAWPEFEEALSLTSSQRTQLAAELAAAGAAATSATAAAAAAAAAAAGSNAGKDDGSASPATAAAVSSLLAVAAGEATASAVAGSSAAAAGASYHAEYGDVRAELVPQMCLLLFREPYFSTPELDSTLVWMKVHHSGMRVVGGASSGAGDLLFSAGAVNRLASDPPASPGFVGLLLCSASDQQPGAASPPAHPAAAAAAAASGASVRSSKSMLPVACFSAHGLGPAGECRVFTDVIASVARHDHNDGPFFEINITAATAVPGTATLPGAGSSSSALQSDTSADPAAAGSSGGADAALPMRRSQCLQQSSAAAAAVTSQEAGASGGAWGKKGLQQLSDVGEDIIEQIEGGDLYVALWRCKAGDVPGPFTGTEDEALVLDVYEFTGAAESPDRQTVQLIVQEGNPGLVGTLPGGSYSDPLAGLPQHSVWQQRPGSRLCMQLLAICGEGSKAAISQGLARAQQELGPVAAAPAAAAAAGCGFMAGCYAAAAANAKEVGARSGVVGQAVFSCTARGRALYSGIDYLEDEEKFYANEHPAEGEAALVDAAMHQACPFVGVYCDGELGPPMQNGCMGWGEEGGSSISHAFTSIFAVFGFLSA